MDDKELQKLLEIAERPKATKTKEVIVRDTDVERYIKKCKIASGETFVANEIIYHHYWRSKSRDRITRAAFFKRFAKYFKRTDTSKGRGYMLDPEPFDLSVEGFFKARALLRKERNDRQKSKKENK